MSIDRITRFLNWIIEQAAKRTKSTAHCSLITALYWLTFASFLTLMLVFVSPTFDKSYTWLATILCILLIITPTDHRFALLTFIAGAGLGYYLELWGTTRECWTYYTNETPPFFAVLAHGMAAVAFWRAGLVLKMLGSRIGLLRPQQVGSLALSRGSSSPCSSGMSRPEVEGTREAGSQ